MLSLLFIVCGIIIASVGSIIGLGGGFILLPVLLFLFPSKPAATLTGISLCVVFINALVASGLYARARRIRYKHSFAVASTAAPGALLGAWLTTLVDRHYFDGVFGLLLCVIGAYMFLLGRQKKVTQSTLDRPLFLLFAVSFFVGVLSSFFGIGGGILLMPILIGWMKLNPTTAAATSLLALALMSMAGVAQHLHLGSLSGQEGIVIPLALGTVIGSRMGVKFALKMNSEKVVAILAVALSLMGIYLAIQGISEWF